MESTLETDVYGSGNIRIIVIILNQKGIFPYVYMGTICLCVTVDQDSILFQSFSAKSQWGETARVGDEIASNEDEQVENFPTWVASFNSMSLLNFWINESSQP